LLYAVYQKKLINVDSFDIEKIKTLSDSKQLFCPDCQKHVLFKECNGRQNHFSHYNLDCTFPFSEPESIEHETGKKAIYDWLVEQFGEDDSFIEKKVTETNQRSDTFVASIKTACEFQCSPIQSKTWRTRNELYKKAKINDLWILGYSMHKYASTSSFLHKLNSLEEEMLSHHGRIIYYDVLTRQFIFLIPDKISKNTLSAQEFFFKPNEVFLKDDKIFTKYDYFFHSQKRRKSFLDSETTKAESTKRMIKEIKTITVDKKKILATSKQVSYIKFLLYQTKNKIPYKFHGLLKSEADQLIKELENKWKSTS